MQGAATGGRVRQRERRAVHSVGVDEAASLLVGRSKANARRAKWAGSTLLANDDGVSDGGARFCQAERRRLSSRRVLAWRQSWDAGPLCLLCLHEQ